MGFLDSIVSKSFRDEQAGRVVVFSGGLRHRSYIVKSEADELKIKSFLKMYYFADVAIVLLGGQVAFRWSTFFSNLQSLGDPSTHLVRTFAIYLGMSSLLVGLPSILLWQSYKKALFSFVSAQDEVSLARNNGGQRQWSVVVALALAFFILAGVIVYPHPNQVVSTCQR